MVDVRTEIVIDRPRSVVAEYAANPDNAPRWYQNIDSAEWQTPSPLAVGSRIAFTARFLGRKLSYVYKVEDFVRGDKLVMRTAQGPFPMETTYTWTDVGTSTRMTLRNRGEPAGFSRIAAPLIATMMRKANRKDLRSIKRVLETHTS
ncbi:MAG TPA: SRPBCC family protein [Glaciibacter sp.]|nr:SRPBCC family protein [Glaciibacter sp.]